MIKNLETRIKLKRDTKENWDNAKDSRDPNKSFVPLEGELIVYEDYPGNYPDLTSESTLVGTEEGMVVTGIKVGDGKTYVQDLPFVGDDIRDKLIKHISDMEVHLLIGDREFWDTKVDVVDFNGTEAQDLWAEHEGEDEDMLILTREDWYESLIRNRKRREEYEPPAYDPREV